MIKKNLSLNRTVIIVMMVGYFMILMLLISLVWYSTYDYQNSKRLRETKRLKDSVTQIGQSMSGVDKIIYDVYANDKNFAKLSQLEDEVQQYDNAYELNITLKNRMFLQDNLKGYYFYYSGEKKVLYYIKDQDIGIDEKSYISTRLKLAMDTEYNDGKWITFVYRGDICAAVICKRDMAAVCGIYQVGKVEDLVEKDPQSEQTVFVIDNGIVLNHAKEAEALKLPKAIEKNDTQFHFRSGNQSVYGHRVANSTMWICVAQRSTLWSYIGLTQIVLVLACIGSGSVLILLYLFMKKEFVRPLKELTLTMNRIREGDWNASPRGFVRFREMQDMNITLTTMVSELEKQKMKSYEETIEKQKAQMQYLQLQLKPHFYLNGLKVLNVLVMDQEKDKMQELIFNLSTHLRYLLQSDREMVTLEEELQYLFNYMELQKNMTGREFVYSVDQEEQTGIFLVPTLCIQTFAENSLKYAKLPVSEPILQIHITIRILHAEKGRYLNIEIKDNGEGYGADVLETLEHQDSIQASGIGIHNLLRRCEILYQKEAEYSFYDEQGAVSELVLPERSAQSESFNCG